AASAGTVVGDDLLLERFGESRDDKTRVDVGLTARRERHYDPDRAGRIIRRCSLLRERGRSAGQQTNRQGAERTWKVERGMWKVEGNARRASWVIRLEVSAFAH